MKRTLLLMSAALPTCIWATAAAAQSTNATGDQADSALADIVVTAQKRAENLQKVPIVITTVEPSRLAEAGVRTTQELNVVVPGVNFRTSLGAFQPFVRGIGTSAATVESPVGLYIDGVYFPQQREGLRDLTDVTQLAVLKGPQGTLFGRNATGGVVQITTRTPSQDPEAEIRLSYSNYETIDASTYVGGGVGPIAASVALAYSTQGDGWGTNSVTGTDTYRLYHAFSVRSKLVFDPGEDTRLVISGDFMDRKESRAPWLKPYEDTTTLPRIAPAPNGGSAWDAGLAVDSLNRTKAGGTSLTLTHDFGGSELTSISAYRKGKFTGVFDNTAGAIRGQDFLFIVPFKSFSQELQIASQPGGPLTWTAGVYYFHNDNRNDPVFLNLSGPLSPLPTTPGRITISSRELTESIAGFAQATINVLDTTRLTVGARYTYEKRKFNGQQDVTLNNGTFIPGALIRGKVSTDRPSWRVSVEHDFSERVMGYLSFNQSFKSGGFSLNSPTAPAYDPETLKAFEAGIKSELFDRTVRFNAAAFYYDYTDVQVNQYLNAVNVLTNGAKAEIYGVDVDFEVHPTSALTLRASAALLHSEFTDYRNAAFWTPRLDANGIPNGGLVATTGDATGNKLPYATPTALSISANYVIPSPVGEFEIAVADSYSSGFATEADNVIKQPSYHLANASLTWTSKKDNLSLRAWIANIFNEAVISQGAGNAPGYQVSYSNPPRTFGLTLGYKY